MASYETVFTPKGDAVSEIVDARAYIVPSSVRVWIGSANA
jgi:hypothetical protein